MPTHRQRAASASSRTQELFGSIPSRTATNPVSYFYPDPAPLPFLSDDHRRPPKEHHHRHFPPVKTAVIDGDPFQIAIEWQNHSFISGCHATSPAGHRAPPLSIRKPLSSGGGTNRILVLNTCSERKPGGDWDGGVLGLGQEESLARRSNLVQCLKSTTSSSIISYYPLPPHGGIYSPETVVFRSGHAQDYYIWPESEWTVLSVVSVAPVKRPKTDESGMRYSFVEEKELQREKMKSILRIAAMNGHVNLVLTGFGSCPPGGDPLGPDQVQGHNGSPHSSNSPTSGGYRNPVGDVAEMWRDLLMRDPEFAGWFENVVFAVGSDGCGLKEFRRHFG